MCAKDANKPMMVLKNKKEEEVEEESEAVSAGKTLRSYDKYSEDMKSLTYLRVLSKKSCEKLLRSLYKLAKQKVSLDNWASVERTDVEQLRAWRKYLNKSQGPLRRAIFEVLTIAEQYPDLYEMELFFDPFEFLTKIEELAKQIGNTSRTANRLETVLAALVNPKLRDDSEKRMVEKEIFPHYLISPRTKSSNINHWAIGRAAAILDEYKDDKGGRIARYDRVISKYFAAAFEYTIEDESVRTTLKRLRSKPIIVEPDPSAIQSLLGQVLDKVRRDKAKNVRTN